MISTTSYCGIAQNIPSGYVLFADIDNSEWKQPLEIVLDTGLTYLAINETYDKKSVSVYSTKTWGVVQTINTNKTVWLHGSYFDDSNNFYVQHGKKHYLKVDLHNGSSMEVKCKETPRECFYSRNQKSQGIKFDDVKKHYWIETDAYFLYVIQGNIKVYLNSNKYALQQ